MFIYNVTVSIDEDICSQWLQWMKEVHIPDVMKSGCFIDNQILEVMGLEEQGPTYSVQYRFKNLSDIENYQANFAKALQAAHKEKFGDKYTAFRTLLKVVG